MSLHLMPLTTECLPDWLAFFEGRAFSDNPRWASCYCAYNYLDHAVIRWHERSGAENRATMCGWTSSGHAQGWLAYRDGVVVGWLNAAPRSRYPAYAEGTPEDATTGAVTCFVIAPEARRQGVASALLTAACNDFAERGFAAVEAWPNREAQTAAAHYHGPLPMYLDRGFVICRDNPGEELIAVRRPLRRAEGEAE